MVGTGSPAKDAVTKGKIKTFISLKVRFSVSHLAGWQARLPHEVMKKIKREGFASPYLQNRLTIC